MRFLSDERQTELKIMERNLVRTLSDAILAASPQIKDTALLTPVTMSLLGMLNRHYLWFKSSGPFTRGDYADLATGLIIGGTRDLVARPDHLEIIRDKTRAI